MKYITKIYIFLFVFLFPLFSVLAIDQTSGSLQQTQGDLLFDKIIIAIGLFVVISAAFFNWESRTKKKKKADTDLPD
ncbi:MAG: hypothetical protein JW822_11175 [Spirochaetales bacterium]|nr:hypothetical protein [Spirochaetales bacterium]